MRSSARLECLVVVTAVSVIAAPSLASASVVHPRFDVNDPAGGPFPSDRFTVPDSNQLTGLRVDLPKPDCAVRPSDCEDLDILNELDGFNVQPRLSIPFDGPIDVTTVTSETVFLLAPEGRRIGINQEVWDVATSTLHVESDELLDQRTRYALIVTRGVLDASGSPVEPSASFDRFRHDLNYGQTKDAGLKAYRKALLTAFAGAESANVRPDDIVVASVFTTMSVTAMLEKIREQVRAAEPPAPADLELGTGATEHGVSTVFSLNAISSMTIDNQVGAGTEPGDFVRTPRSLAQLRIIPELPNAVGTLAFGSYRSPVFRNAELFIEQVPTRTGIPAIQGEDLVYFNLFLPSAPKPEGGWPVAIYGVGCCVGDSKNITSFNVAAVLAKNGIATIAINAAGQGFGPSGAFTVNTGGVAITFPAGGRSIDVDEDGSIGAGEGTEPPGARRLLFARDGRLQTIADLMQLVRVIEVGIDVDGDDHPDLDPGGIYYLGFSSGAHNGAPFVAVEPGVRAAVLSVPGGLVGERSRLSPGGRVDLHTLLSSREPPLLNLGGVDFDENLPLRDEPAPTVNTVAGAMDVQEVLERMEWAYMTVDAAAFAPYLRLKPLRGAQRPVIIQFAKGDQTVPNPSTSALLRAGQLADRATYYRTDFAVCRYGNGPVQGPPNPPPGVENNGHNFLARVNSPTRTAIARAAQEQAASFFLSDGADTLDANVVVNQLLEPGPSPSLFEVPLVPPLPEVLGFVPVAPSPSECP